MSRIKMAFENSKKAFIGYVVAGDPSIEQSIEYILAMAEEGADIIEIGVPFSDPISEGEVIHNANLRALDNKVNLESIFAMVEKIRAKSDVALALLTYANPIFKYGYDKVCAKCRKVGIDGIIIADMPHEHKDELRIYAQGVDIIELISPTTSQYRIKQMTKDASGYIYVVSSLGVTGMRDSLNDSLKANIQRIKKYTDIPCAVGFGIHTPDQVQAISQIADGVIVGSKIVSIIEQNDAKTMTKLRKYIKEMKKAMI